MAIEFTSAQTWNVRSSRRYRKHSTPIWRTRCNPYGDVTCHTPTCTLTTATSLCKRPSKATTDTLHPQDGGLATTCVGAAILPMPSKKFLHIPPWTSQEQIHCINFPLQRKTCRKMRHGSDPTSCPTISVEVTENLTAPICLEQHLPNHEGLHPHSIRH